MIVGNLRTDNLWATYFAGDRLGYWVFRLARLISYRDFWLKPERMTAIQQSMFHTVPLLLRW